MSRKLPDSMHWQIYQADLRGPSALFQLFEDAFGRLALHGDPDPDMQQREINALSEQIARLKVQIERLQAEVSQRHGRNFRLGRRNSEPEALCAKDSHNSSRPPSTDPPWAKRTKSLRRPSGRRPGGQVGPRGSTLRLSSHPHRVVEHQPRQCRSCHASLAAGQFIRYLRQQVWEVVPAKLKMTEHRLAVLRCTACGKVMQGECSGAVRSGVQYGPSVKARVLYLQHYQLLPYQRTSEALRDLFGCRLSAGTVANIVRECAAGTRCRHALCGVHLLRELTYFEELDEVTKAWAAPLKQLLLEMKAEVEREREVGGNRLNPSVLIELSGRYD